MKKQTIVARRDHDANGARPWRGQLGRVLSVAAGLLGAFGCAAEPGRDGETAEDMTEALSANEGRLWESKLLGTHNSYSRYDDRGPDHQHHDLAQQLDLGVRTIEIDVVHESGRVSHGGNPFARTHCGNIDECLGQINAWSDAHGDHTPIVVYVEFSEEISWSGMRRTKTIPTYNKIKDAYRARVPDHKKITGDDGNSTIGQLRGKIALAIYRKRGDWDPLLPFLRFDGERDGYLSGSKIFVAGKSTEDGDFSWNPGPGTLHFVKGDHMNADPAWAETWKQRPVFFSANVCDDYDCLEERGDKQRMQSVFSGTLVNGLMSNEVGDLVGWLGRPQDVYVNTLRNPAAPRYLERKVALRTVSGSHFLSAEGGGAGAVVASRSAAGAWETFALVDMGGGKVALRASNDVNYLSAEAGGGGPLVADKAEIGPWETFTRVDLGGDAIALQTDNGRYLCAEGGGGSTMSTDRTAIGPWETFTLLYR